MSIITIAYYALTAFLLGLVVWNFIREKSSRDRLVLYLLVMVPLVLRLLRVK
jgi:DMSO reductase anchor subunit